MAQTPHNARQGMDAVRENKSDGCPYAIFAAFFKKIPIKANKNIISSKFRCWYIRRFIEVLSKGRIMTKPDRFCHYLRRSEISASRGHELVVNSGGTL